jgi:rare lipoprotein A
VKYQTHQVKGEKMNYSLIPLIITISLAAQTEAVANSHTTNSINDNNLQKKSDTKFQASKRVIVPNIKKVKAPAVEKKVKVAAVNHIKPVGSIPLGSIGFASWYGYESGPRFRHQPKTASGVIFNPRKLTAAHKSFPFGAKIKVTNLKNHRAVVVEINDRGPYAHHRIIDLSKAAALAIGMDGVQKVSLNRI